MNNTQEMPTAGGPKPEGLKTAEPLKQAAAPPAVMKESTLDLPVDGIELAGFFKVREQFTDVGELAESMKKEGQLAPVIVRAIGPARYQLVAGYRRLHAAKKAGLKTIRATVRVLDDKQAHLVALAENLQRRDLSPIEEADAFASAVGHGGWQQKDLAKALGKSEAYISNRLRLKKLPEDVQELISDGQITAGHAEHAILKFEDKTVQSNLAKEIVKRKMDVRDSEHRARELEESMKARAKLDAAVKDAKFKTCPKCKRPAVRFHWQFRSAVECNSGHAWNPGDGKDPEAAEQEKWRASSGSHGGGMARDRKIVHNYEPTEYRIPASQEEIARGVLRYLAEKATNLEVSDGGWHGISFSTKERVPFPAPRFHGSDAQFRSRGYVTAELAHSSSDDKVRTEHRERMEKFLRQWVPKAAKKIPEEGLHGVTEMSKKCPGCEKRVGPAPLRFAVTCSGCGHKFEMLRKKAPAPAKSAKKAGKTCKAKCPSCSRLCENEVLGAGKYCGSIKTAVHEHDEGQKGGMGHKWKPGAAAPIAGWAGAKKKAGRKPGRPKGSKNKASGRAKSPASPSEKRKKGRK